MPTLRNLTISSPLAFAEGLLFFFKLFLKKEGFLKLVSNFNTSGIEYLYHIFELQYKLIFF